MGGPGELPRDDAQPWARGHKVGPAYQPSDRQRAQQIKRICVKDCLPVGVLGRGGRVEDDPPALRRTDPLKRLCRKAIGVASSLPRDLSLGQQALVGIARGFAKQPRLLVMDELLDGLGTDASNEALGLLHELANSNPPCGVLLSASSMEPVTLADRIWSIHKKGLKLETGYTKITRLRPWAGA